ncbi:hypothetical protein BOTBODRAFT_192493 [Botryobasidium botryosum FD-172 SS1]|uniref:Uncharacterized protein n=1 Tax=Botryobasidium botryosum (strain FD-172 SS1) TaxID=930990 RepID=A0A067LVV0_BOTB1|nr:hypothetical protein BOTBODRAFT_192493 [Botryobasidium botryosum FD-172 SS1]
MEDIILPAVPKFIQCLYQHISCELDRDWFGGYEGIDDTEMDSYIDRYYRCHNPDGTNDGNTTIESLEEEHATLQLVRALATKAIHSCTGQLISAVNFKRNQLIPVQRLPGEVLSIIFGVVGSSRGNSRLPLIKRAPLNLSAVSKTWREVAINTPRLWAKIDAFNAHIAPLFLERSKQLPLQMEVVPISFYASSDEDDEDDEDYPFYYEDDSDDYEDDSDENNEDVGDDDDEDVGDGDEEDVGDDDGEDAEGDTGDAALEYPDDPNAAYWSQMSNFPRFIDPLIPHRNRWLSLMLEAIGINTLARKLTFPVFHLETFHLTSPDSFPSVVPTESTSAVTLFSGVAPRLRDLHLAGYCLPLTSAIFYRLTSLHLERIRYNRSSVHQLLRALDECPDLVNLALIKLVFPPIPPSPTPTVPKPALLHHLRKAVLHLPISSYIIRSILPPPTVQLELNTGDHFQAYFPDAVPNASRIGTLLIGHFPRYFVSGWALGGDEKILDLDFDYNAPRPDVLRGLIRILSFPCLESLVLSCLSTDTIDASTFAEILGSLPTITTLSLSACSLTLAPLIITPSSHLSPRLQTLRIDLTRLGASAIVELVKSRSGLSKKFEPGEAHLNRLILSRCYEEDHQIISELTTHIEVVMEESSDFPFFL